MLVEIEGKKSDHNASLWGRLLILQINTQSVIYKIQDFKLKSSFEICRLDVWCHHVHTHFMQDSSMGQYTWHAWWCLPNYSINSLHFHLSLEEMISNRSPSPVRYCDTVHGVENSSTSTGCVWIKTSNKERVLWLKKVRC